MSPEAHVPPAGKPQAPYRGKVVPRTYSRDLSLKLLTELEEFDRVKPICIEALSDYLMETEQYLTSYGPDLEHSDCCPRHQVREASRAAGQASLVQRKDAIMAALYVCGAVTQEAL